MTGAEWEDPIEINSGTFKIAQRFMEILKIKSSCSSLYRLPT